MGGIFSSPKAPAPLPPPPAPIAPPPPPSKTDKDVKASATEERLRRAKAIGRNELNKTGGQGVTDETDSPSKKLLGDG